jgi:asparagine synthase (glutamine-hydrolysing)|tara:strand:- start:518 stop:2089 length:1572 start_codon:yes stop_codon:yes gene_type:complete
MCGLLFALSQKSSNIKYEKFEAALKEQSWRGPDNFQIYESREKHLKAGHVRLSIVDQSERSNQPYINREHGLIYNGEIYNYVELSRKYFDGEAIPSDTLFLFRFIERFGTKKLNELEGMFAFVFFNINAPHDFICARDIFGIKPLYIHNSPENIIISSESTSIESIVKTGYDEISLVESVYLRSHCPGFSFINRVHEVDTGSAMEMKKGELKSIKYEKPLGEIYVENDDTLEKRLVDSVKAHQMGESQITTMISSGVDSSLVSMFADKASKLYSIGTNDVNEFTTAKETASILGKELVQVVVTQEKIEEKWLELVALKREPLLVPNEALINIICNSFDDKTKVVLTGEGADEIFMGYTGIFREILSGQIKGHKSFYDRYSYTKTKDNIQKDLGRFDQWNRETNGEELNIKTARNFFLNFHMRVLLRRMDFASMTASKEARTPFLNRNILSYANTLNVEKLMEGEGKAPLRRLLANSKLKHVSRLQKRAFSITKHSAIQKDEYGEFRNIIKYQLEKIKDPNHVS